MTDDMKLIIREFFKFIFFGMYIAGAVVFAVLITSIDIHTLGYIPENSLTERTQEALLAISILSFLSCRGIYAKSVGKRCAARRFSAD